MEKVKQETSEILKKDEQNMKRQRCEVYSRVTGYLTPTNQWNDAKSSEFIDRKTFNVN